MKLRSLLIGLAVILLPLASLFSQSRELPNLSGKVAYGTHGAMKLLRINSDGTPSVMVGVNDDKAELVAIGSRNSEREVSLASRVWMASISESVLGLSNQAELRETAINRTNDLWLSSHELFYNGIPVRERIAHLNIGAQNGKVILLRNNLPSVKPVTSTPGINKNAVMSLSFDIVGSNATVVEDAHLIYVHNRYPERLDLCYETIIRTAKGDELWRLTFDAITGELLERKDLIVKNCFQNNPLTASEDNTLRRSESIPNQHTQATATGNVSALVHLKSPLEAPTTVSLSNLELTVNALKVYTDTNGNFTASNINNPLIISSSQLKSKYITVNREDGLAAQLTDTFAISPANIVFNDQNSDISERDVFYSLEDIRSHIRRLDPALTRLDQPMYATVNYPGECNAFYDRSTTLFVFFDESNACNNIAHVADVAYHEFGHRVNHARYGQAGNNDRSMVDGSLNEGFADVISAFKRDDPRIGVGFYKSSPTRVLRNIQNTNKWPKNINSDTHYNGLIVAGAFWDLRKTMGLAETEKLFHLMGYQRPDGPGGVTAGELEEAFTNTLLATIITDDDDNDLTNGTPNLQKIINAFEKHNITLSGLIELTPEQIPDHDISTPEYPVTVHAEFASSLGSLDTTNVRVYYRHIDSNSYKFITLDAIDNNTFIGAIPKMPNGSVVEYYATAATTLSSTSLKEAPLPTSPLRFLVGYNSKLLDECETNFSWTKQTTTDDAVNGVWIHGKPFGTYYQSVVNGFVQQDTDHSPTGINCFVTGNTQSRTPSTDDVDNGTTTLISPVYDLSAMRNPVIRWWYYYSNNTGQNPGLTKWIVKISNNDGIDYTTVHSTTAITNGWEKYEIKVKDYYSLTDKVRVQFIASDNIGALVEAGVDDIEIFDIPATESVYGNDGVTSTLTLFPNPVTGSTVTINHNGLELHSLGLRDMLGKVVLSREYRSAYGNTIELAIPESLANGAYMLEYTTRDGTTRREKLVIAR